MTQGLSAEEGQRLEALFERAALLPPGEHEAFLERECGTRGALRDELGRLLAGLAGEDLLGRIRPEAPSRVGTRIGPYELREKVGEGGMGEVYAAWQVEPVQRKVALKLIRSGMDSQQVVARFEAERQALAMMDHPHIARVLDGGSTETGQPYFVMEYIEGVPILEYCDAHRLDTGARLRLFVKVCHAVQHAHQKGIVHRDLKPGNVQVTLHDGVASPKVIDFGIAKAIHQDALPGATLTRHLQLVGTPAYMSPEQAGMTHADIDTRSDIYSLGVLLYELLTGTTPFDTRRLEEAGLAELVRLICEETPHKPSTRISTLGQGTTSADVRRRIDGRRLALDLRGDLDWIVMKCLEKDRDRRYETANGLAADLERHLRDEPVTAGPPSRSYRLRKFVRRNRVGVIAASLIALVLLLGAGGTTWGMLWALDETERADGETRKAQQAALDAARARDAERERADQLGQVAAFQAARMGQVDPMTMGANMRQALLAAVPEERRKEVERAIQGVPFTDLALETLEHDVFRPSQAAIDARFQDQPEVQAQLLAALGSALYQVGLYELATDPTERAWQLWNREAGPEDPRTLDALNARGVLLFSKGQLAEAEPLILEAVKGLTEALGEDDPVSLNALDCLGDLRRDQGRLAEAESLFRKVLEYQTNRLGEDDPSTLQSLRVLGAVLREQGRTDEAEVCLLDALERQGRLLGEGHWDTLDTCNSLAVLFHAQGRLEEAERYHRRSLSGYQDLLGSDHPVTLTSMSNLSGVLLALRGFDEALPLAEESARRHRAVLGDSHPRTLVAIADLGAVLVSMGRFPEALPFLQEALAGQDLRLDEDGPDRRLVTLNNLGHTLRQLGRHADALPFLEEALEGQRLRQPGDPATLGVVICNLAGAFQSLDRFEESEERYREALAVFQSLEEERAETFQVMDNLGVLLLKRVQRKETGGRREAEVLEEAESLVEAALEGERSLLGEDHINTRYTQMNLGSVLQQQGLLSEAEGLYREAEDGFRRLLPDGFVPLLTALNNRGVCLRKQDRLAEAEACLIESLDGLQQVYGQRHPYTLTTGANIGFVVHGQGRSDEALPFYREAVDGLLDRGDLALCQDILQEWLRIGAEVDPESWTLHYARSKVGILWQRQGQFARAEASLLASQEGLEQRESAIPEEFGAVQAEVLQGLAALYDRWDQAVPGEGHAEQAARWRARWEDAQD